MTIDINSAPTAPASSAQVTENQSGPMTNLHYAPVQIS
jgi:hypothetical protein